LSPAPENGGESKNVSKLSLSLTALVSGLMGFMESTAAAPAQSTAMAGAALGFLLISSLAWLELWTQAGAFRQPQIILRAIGFVLVMLGLGVLLITAGRLFYGSHPSPSVMALFACLGAAVNLLNAALLIQRRRQKLTMKSVWIAARNDLAVSAALLLAAGATLLTESNVADVAVGGALAALGTYTGARILARGTAG
jgi:hypothetical protein